MGDLWKGRLIFVCVGGADWGRGGCGFKKFKKDKNISQIDIIVNK